MERKGEDVRICPFEDMRVLLEQMVKNHTMMIFMLTYP